MKKTLALILATIMTISVFTGCGNVGGISDYPPELEEAGISQEEYSAMSDEEKKSLLDELGIVADIESGKQENKPTEKPKELSISDIQNGGSYRVTAAGPMFWNYFELYYEDGKLVKIFTSFQKSDEEEAEVETIEGDAIADYQLYFIDYTQSPDVVVNALKDQGFTNVYVDKI